AVASPQRETDDTLGLEAATALLFVEQMFERGLERAGELDARVGELAQRLHHAAAGKGELGPVPDWLLALGHAAQERSTLAAFVAETRTTLQSIEQVLDIYFRDASQCDGLPAAALQLRQIGGALRMIGEHRAGDDAIELAERVASFVAAAEATGAGDDEIPSEPAQAEL